MGADRLQFVSLMEELLNFQFKKALNLLVCGDSSFSIMKFLIFSLLNINEIFLILINCDLVIVEQICYQIGIYNHDDYAFQLVEGDFKKPRWLAKNQTLDEQGVQRHHILRLLRRIFFPLGFFRDRSEAVLLFPQVLSFSSKH